MARRKYRRRQKISGRCPARQAGVRRSTLVGVAVSRCVSCVTCTLPFLRSPDPAEPRQ